MPENGEGRRFQARSPGFIRRARLVNGLLGGWSIVVGTGSLVEAHLVSRLGLATSVPNLRGCGITAREVKDLVQEVLAEEGRLPLVLLLDSVASDQGQQLMRDLRRRLTKLQILLLVQDDSWISAAALAACQAQAIVHVQSFGNGTMIKALQALRRGQRFQDPLLKKRLQEQLQPPEAMTLSSREQQTLEGLARGRTNKQIALEAEIAATTIRDYVSSLCRKLGVNNRTQAVSQAMAMGLIGNRHGPRLAAATGQRSRAEATAAEATVARQPEAADVPSSDATAQPASPTTR
ncbi:MAG: response regulator transcription factor [Cyanobacteria bacterium]|nr:response regulator transcription factor [Cyanobacteriota bacterium]